MFVTALLIVSGLVHLGLLAVQGASWEGPISPRKPALFGISGGLTTWSIAWLMTQLKPKKYDCALSNAISVCLLIEVALITLQFWRGVPSHFNASTLVDAAIEYSMLGLILAVTMAIVYLAFRTLWLRAMEPSMALAIRGGMWLVALSCGLGVLTTVFGEWSVARGNSSELWGKAGVLKFPHGVALHAIQYFPIAAWVAQSLRVKNPYRVLQALLFAQVLFLFYAIWQTSQGRSRFDFDWVGGILLGITTLSGMLALATTVQALYGFAFVKGKNVQS